MAEQPPAFVVVDKRKYTADGAIREGFKEPEPREEPAIQALEPASTETKPEPAPAAAAPAGPAKIVTMPTRNPAGTSAAMSAADDLLEEEMAGTLGQAQDDLRGEPYADEPLAPRRSAAETAAQESAYQQSSLEIEAMLQQANPGMQPAGAVTFEHVIQSFYLSGIMAMGAGTEPGQKPRIDIVGARQSIDMLTLLEEKTRGNLSEPEQQLLQGVTFEMRMMFLELTNAISKQAQQPAPGGSRGTPPGAGLR